MKLHRIPEDSKVTLAEIAPDDTGDYPANDKGKSKNKRERP